MVLLPLDVDVKIGRETVERVSYVDNVLCPTRIDKCPDDNVDHLADVMVAVEFLVPTGLISDMGESIRRASHIFTTSPTVLE
jgi:hypothetical protein